MEFSQDELMNYMVRCIDIAKKSYLEVDINEEAIIKRRLQKPFVGALVISTEGKIIGEGYKKFLDSTNMIIHAERMAMGEAESLAKGSTLITTLEPCNKIHRDQIFKPCIELIVEMSIKTVVVGLNDKNIHMNGSSLNYLKNKGINVIKFYELKDRICKELM